MRRIAKATSTPAPTGGLNVADNLLAMQPTDATVLHNFFTQPYGCELRQGNIRHATGLGSSVGTIIEHVTARSSNVNKLFAFADGKMFDVTAPGDAARVASLSGLTNNVWNGPAISNASGYNRILFNGVNDGIWIKDDFTIARLTAAATPGSPVAGEIDGVDPADLIGGTVHQKRIWLIEKDSTKAWYLAPEAISGTATLFDFGAIFQRGGYLAAMNTWTVDAGAGVDDLLVAISSRGEIAIYEGTDPDTVGSWQLKGVFQAGAPLGHRCLAKVEGDLFISTVFGVLSLSEAMRGSTVQSASSSAYVSRKIQSLVTGLASSLSTTFGWDLLFWPNNNMVVVNVPKLSGSGQLVHSVITSGWSQFDDWDAMCWSLFSDGMVYGDRDGNIWRAWEGYTDNSIQSDAVTITDGNPIRAIGQSAFNYLQSGAVVKHPKLIRPTFVAPTDLKYGIRVNSDFNYTEAALPSSSGALSDDALWGTAVWGTDVWAGATQSTLHVWTGVAGIGTSFGARVILYEARPVVWAGWDLLHEDGIGI